MNLFANIMVCVVALEHIGFMVLEMFYWDHPVGRKVFEMSAEQSAFSATLAFNQGLYNSFLAAGLIWGLVTARTHVVYFFLICVVVAGVVGGVTVKPSILVTQGLPAVIALLSVWLAARQ